MRANGVSTGFRRRSRAEVARLVSEFEQSGLGRKEFSAAHGLSVHTLDAWRRRVARPASEDRIVPVELVEDRDRGIGFARAAGRDSLLEQAPRRGGQMRVLLASGLRIEVEPGFDVSELRRLIAGLGGMAAMEPQPSAL